ncbi:MAG: exo-alpha-sialidase [Clostridiales bacterium]|nr:exo-alpha-sialidase [Clostridiales bacterium]
MKGITGWHYKPYRPAHRLKETQLPFICRIAPEETAITLEWFDKGSLGEHILQWRIKDSDLPWNSIAAASAEVRIEGLELNQDYEFCIIRKGRPQEASPIRYARTGHVPGRVINYLHPEDKLYAFSGRALCSPSIVKLPSGALLVSMDLFAPAAPQNLTLLFRSDDGGKSWRYVTDLFPCYWGTLFIHRDRLYMLGCSTEYGDIVIGVSDDEGHTWSRPAHLFVGSGSHLSAGWQRAPLSIINTNGRLYTSVDYGAWEEGGHSIGMLSIPEDADLLDSRYWTCSELIDYDPGWPGAPKGNSTGMLEGNMVLSKDGKLLNLLRIGLINCEPSHGIAVLLEADPDRPEAPLKLHRFINMPSGSNSKSYVLFDRVSGYYIAIGNICVDPTTPGQRNVLALQASEDLYNWRVVKTLLDYRNEDPNKVGFQYISFLIEGDDIFYVSRTAINGARNYHDANCITFHTIGNFRRYL